MGMEVEFTRFYNEERDRIGRALALVLGDDALGFEAVDEAMTRAYLRWDKLADGTNPAGWVYRTGLNWSRSRLRRRSRGRQKHLLAASEDRAMMRPADTDLARALAGLDDDRRAVVVARYLLDWPVDEVATALNIPPGTVKSRLSRALDQLAASRDHYLPRPPEAPSPPLGRLVARRPDARGRHRRGGRPAESTHLDRAGRPADEDILNPHLCLYP